MCGILGANASLAALPMSTPSPLRCPSCASNLKAQDIDTARGLITCSYCGALMNLAASPSTPGAPSGPAFTPRPEVPLPPRIRIAKTERGIELSWRWSTPVLFFLIPFTIVWDAFLVFWYSMAGSSGAPWILVLFPMAHVAVGVGLTYFVIASLLNTTRITVAPRALEVRHGPIPWRGNAVFERSHVEQLFCKRKEKRGKHGPYMTYELWLSLRGPRAVRLVSNGLEEEQVLYLEQRIESALGLADRSMAGELPR